MIREDPARAFRPTGTGLLPAHFLELPISAPERPAIGIVVQPSEGGSLGANKALAKGIVLVAAHTDDSAPLDLHDDAARSHRGGQLDRLAAR